LVLKTLEIFRPNGRQILNILGLVPIMRRLGCSHAKSCLLLWKQIVGIAVVSRTSLSSSDVDDRSFITGGYGNKPKVPRNAVCFLPAKTGPCRALFYRWWVLHLWS